MVRWNGRLMMLLAGLAAAGNTAVAGDDTKGDPMHPHVMMETSLGNIVLALDAEKAPASVLNFVQYAEDKFYDGTIFHRVIKDFMIQGGGFTVDLDEKEGLRPGITNEWKNGLKNTVGTISMARVGGNPDSATSQFFINVVDNSRLDQPQSDGAAYAVFGKVVEGMDVVEKIRDTEVDTHEKYGGGRNRVVPVEPIVIKSVKLVSPFDRTKVESIVKLADEEKGRAVQAFVEKTEKETGKKVVKTDSGLMYFDLTDGDGEMPEKTSKVEVHYTGWLLDGSKFDSSVDRGQPFAFSLAGGVIGGWLEGVATMKVGGKRKLIIPPALGYGSRGAGAKIPPNSTLVFDVELLNIVE